MQKSVCLLEHNRTSYALDMWNEFFPNILHFEIFPCVCVCRKILKFLLSFPSRCLLSVFEPAFYNSTLPLCKKKKTNVCQTLNAFENHSFIAFILWNETMAVDVNVNVNVDGVFCSANGTNNKMWIYLMVMCSALPGRGMCSKHFNVTLYSGDTVCIVSSNIWQWQAQTWNASNAGTDHADANTKLAPQLCFTSLKYFIFLFVVHRDHFDRKYHHSFQTMCACAFCFYLAPKR